MSEASPKRCPRVFGVSSQSVGVALMGCRRSSLEVSKGEKAMSTDEMIAVHRRFDEQVITQGRLELLDEIFTPDCVYHNPPGPDLIGPESVRQLMAQSRAAFPDVYSAVDDRFVAGDKLVVRGVLRATHKGEFMGLHATGKRMSLDFLAIHRFVGDRIKESWNLIDNLGMLQQLGAIPSPGEAKP
jgi:predicted ester cyclase